jgi:DNA-directed RNA polymerase specialized sigma24 family protein
LAVRGLRRDRLRSRLDAEVDARPPAGPVDVNVLRAVAKLTPTQRATVALYYFEDRPISEVADLLNCAQATARVHLHRARKRLASLLTERVADVH